MAFIDSYGPAPRTFPTQPIPMGYVYIQGLGVVPAAGARGMLLERTFRPSIRTRRVLAIRKFRPVPSPSRTRKATGASRTMVSIRPLRSLGMKKAGPCIPTLV